MYLVTLSASLTISRGRILAPGHYIADSIDAGTWLRKDTVAVRITPYHPGPINLGKLAALGEAASLCIIRPGGIGDLIMMTPALRALRQALPFAVIDVCTHAWNGVVLDRNPHISKTVTYPLPVTDAEKYSCIVSLEDVLEYHPEQLSLPALDIFTETLGGPKLGNRRPVYTLGSDETVAALARYPLNPERWPLRIGVQLAASHPARTYEWTDGVIKILAQNRCEVLVFGEPNRHVLEHPFGDSVKVLPMEKPAPSIRESIALAETCDGLVVPDSSMVHVAGALGIPAVAIYGSFPWQVRTADYPTVRALTGKAPCAPCAWHGRGSLWPEGKPCATKGSCVALGSITPREVVNTLLHQIERVPR